MSTITIKRIGAGGTSSDVYTLSQLNAGSVIHRELMSEHYIQLNFETDEPVYFKVGDYCVLDGYGRFELVDPYSPTFNQRTGGYSYELRLDAYYWKWKNKKCKYVPTNAATETSFSLTASITTHIQVALRTINALGTTAASYKYNGTTDYVYALTNYDADDVNACKLITYDSINIIDALTLIAETFECEWWVTDNCIHFGRCEGSAAEVEFTIGSNVCSMSSAQSASDYATRIIAFGSDKNLPTNYRQEASADITVNGVIQKRLMLPLLDEHGQPLCPHGYVQAADVANEEQAIEKVIVFDDIYPRVQCVVDVVTTYTKPIYDEDGHDTGEVQTFYRVTDSSGFNFNTGMILEGQTLHIQFTSGRLNGMDFECQYSDREHYYEIVSNEDYGRILPDTLIYPSHGDTFVLYGWDATQMASTGIIEDAELELYERTCKWLQKTKIDPNTYTCTLFSDWVAENVITRTYELGRKVLLTNIGYLANARSSRVIGFEFKLDYPYDSPQYIVGENAEYSRLSDVEKKVEQLTVNGVSYIGSSGSGGGNVYVIAVGDTTPASDSNVFSARRSLAEFISKQKDDIAAGHITFNKGITAKDIAKLLGGAFFGQFIEGLRGGKIDANGNAELNNLQARGDASVTGNLAVGGLLRAARSWFDHIQSSNYSGSGAFDTGFMLTKDSDGQSMLVVDKLYARVKAVFEALEIRKMYHTGGNAVFSAAGSTIERVDYIDADGEVLGYETVKVPWLLRNSRLLFRLNNALGIYSTKRRVFVGVSDITKVKQFRCWLKADDGTLQTANTWMINDQARCQTLNLVSDKTTSTGYFSGRASNKHYWRLVTGMGSGRLDDNKWHDYIDLSVTDCETGSDNPEAGDDIVQMGNRTDAERQGFITIEVLGSDAPAIKEYAGVNGYSLEGKRYTMISPHGDEFYASKFEIRTTYGIFRVPTDRGEWSQAVVDNKLGYYYYDRVYWSDPSTGYGGYWLCIIPEEYQYEHKTNGTAITTAQWNALATDAERAQYERRMKRCTEKPGKDATYWQLQVSNGRSYNGGTEWYALGASDTTAPAGWNTMTNGKRTPSDGWQKDNSPAYAGDDKKYLWNMEVTVDSQGNEFWTPPICIGNHAKGIKDMSEKYGISASAEKNATTGAPKDTSIQWLTALQTISPTDAKPYLWNWTKTTYSDGTEDNIYHILAVKGQAQVVSTVFQRSETKPDKPTTGDYNNLVPTGWEDGIPAGTLPIWTTKRRFTSDGINQDTAWGDVVLLEDTEDRDMEFSPCQSTPPTPTDGNRSQGRYNGTKDYDGSGTYKWFDPTLDKTTVNWENMYYMAVRERYVNASGVPAWGDWVITRIKGEEGKPGTSVSVSSRSVKYAKGDNGQTAPAKTSDLWKDTITATGAAAGDWLWTWVHVEFSDGKDYDTFSPSRMGIDGNGIKDSEVKYCQQASRVSPETIDEANWKTFAQLGELTTGHWLYTRTKITYSDGNSTYIYGASRIGVDGAAYAGGTEYYALSASNTEPPTGYPAKGEYANVNAVTIGGTWSTARPTANASTPYLWNFEITLDSNGKCYVTEALCIGNFARGIRTFIELYGISTSGEKITTGVKAGQPKEKVYESDGTTEGWTDELNSIFPTEEKPYLWNKTITVYNDSVADSSEDSWDDSTCDVSYHVMAVRGGDGKRGRFLSRVFCRTNDDLTDASIKSIYLPTGGTYDSPWPTQPASVWHDGIPAGDERIWSSSRWFGTDEETVWSDPQPESDTSLQDIEFSMNAEKPNPPAPSTVAPPASSGTIITESGYGSRANGSGQQADWYDPQKDAANTHADWMKMKWRAERQIRNGLYSGNWVITQIVGEKGDAQTITNIGKQWKAGTSETVEPGGNWYASPSAAGWGETNQCLWCKETTTLSSGDPIVTIYFHSRYGRNGTNGKDAFHIYLSPVALLFEQDAVTKTIAETKIVTAKCTRGNRSSDSDSNLWCEINSFAPSTVSGRQTASVDIGGSDDELEIDVATYTGTDGKTHYYSEGHIDVEVIAYDGAGSTTEQATQMIRLEWRANLVGTWIQTVTDDIESTMAERVQNALDENGDFTTVKNNYTQIRRSVSSLESWQTEVNENITDLHTEYNDAQSSISTITDNVSGLQTQVTQQADSYSIELKKQEDGIRNLLDCTGFVSGYMSAWLTQKGSIVSDGTANRVNDTDVTPSVYRNSYKGLLNSNATTGTGEGNQADEVFSAGWAYKTILFQQLWVSGSVERIVPNEWNTISFWAKGGGSSYIDQLCLLLRYTSSGSQKALYDSSKGFSIYVKGNSRYYKQETDGTIVQSGNLVSMVDNGEIVLNLTDSWQRYAVTFFAVPSPTDAFVSFILYNRPRTNLSGTAKPNMLYLCMPRLEMGTDLHAYAYEYKGRKKTGLYLEEGKFAAMADNFEIQNGSGETTFSVNENGDLYGAGNAMFGGVVFTYKVWEKYLSESVNWEVANVRIAFNKLRYEMNGSVIILNGSDTDYNTGGAQTLLIPKPCEVINGLRLEFVNPQAANVKIGCVGYTMSNGEVAESQHYSTEWLVSYDFKVNASTYSLDIGGLTYLSMVVGKRVINTIPYYFWYVVAYNKKYQA